MTVLSYRLEDILKKRRNRWAGPHADRGRDSEKEKEAREAKAKEEAEKKKKKLTDFKPIPEKTPKQRKREVRDDRQRITEREDAESQQSVPVNYTVRDDKLGQLDGSERTFSDEQKKEEETQQKIRDANAAAKKKLAEDAKNDKKYGINLDNFKRFVSNQEEKKTKKKKRRLGSKEGQEDKKTWSKEDLDSLDLGTSKETTFADSEEAKDDKVDKADKKEVKLTEGGKKVLDEAKRYASLNMYKSWLETRKDVSGAMGGTRGLGHDGGSKQSPGSSAQITEVIDQKLDDGEALNAEIKRGVKTSVNNIEGASTKAAYENHEQDEGTDVKPNSQQINPARPKVDALKAKHLYKKTLVVKYNNIYKPLNI